MNMILFISQNTSSYYIIFILHYFIIYTHYFFDFSFETQTKPFYFTYIFCVLTVWYCSKYSVFQYQKLWYVYCIVYNICIWYSSTNDQSDDCRSIHFCTRGCTCSLQKYLTSPFLKIIDFNAFDIFSGSPASRQYFYCIIIGFSFH